MLSLETTGQFRKDYKRIKERGYDTKLLEDIIQMLLEEKPFLSNTATMRFPETMQDSGSAISSPTGSSFTPSNAVG